MAEVDASPSSCRAETARALAEFDAQEQPLTQDGIPAYRIERDVLSAVLTRLRDTPELSYEMLNSLTAVDWPDRQPRYEVVLHLWSLRYNEVLRLKVGVPEEDPRCPSAVGHYPGAEWQEREVFDMFGIQFEGHPDLRRILMPEDYPFFPLRKDFPIEGIDNAVSYRNLGGVLMTDELEVDRPPGQDETPVDRSHGDPEGYTDGAETLED